MLETAHAAALLSESVMSMLETMRQLGEPRRDGFMPIGWLDRAVACEMVPLAAYEAETQAYVLAKALWSAATRLFPSSEDALEALAGKIESGIEQGGEVFGLAFLLAVLDVGSGRHAELASKVLNRCASALKGDPNVGRLEIRINDLATGGRHFDAVLEHLGQAHCNVPFEHLESVAGGNMYLCCPAWLPVSSGNLFDLSQTAASGFLGSDAQRVRDSVRDRSFRYCNWSACPKIATYSLPPAQLEPLPEPRTPAEVYLSHDPSCNLSCPSCRQTTNAIGSQERAWLDRRVMSNLGPFLADAECVKVTGSGDPFASRHFRQLLASPVLGDRRNIYLHTNALLFDEAAFKSLRLSGRIRQVEVSIDAATADTYRVVRRGGEFEDLLERLAYIAELRRSGEIPYLQFDFVVQKENFREIPAFVSLAKEFAADRAFFSAVRNWVFTHAEFQDADVCAPAHPLHQELLQVLNHPAINDEVTDIGSLAHLRVCG